MVKSEQGAMDSQLPISLSSLDLLLHSDEEKLPGIASVSSSGASTSALSTNTSETTTNEPELVALPVIGLYQRKELPKEVFELSVSKLSRDQVMARTRVETGEGLTFQQKHGHIGSQYYHTYHEGENGIKVLGERAVLLQSIHHYDMLRRHPDLAKYFANDENDSDTEIDHANILDHPSFGEQIIIGEGTAKDFCIGDILEVENGESTLKLEISSPRKCCVRVNKKNNSSYGLNGVRRHCNETGLGGIFARVLEEGELKEGMQFVRTANPHPKWTLANVCKSLYGEAPRAFALKNWAFWSRSKEELEELYSIEQLGCYEWKDEVQYILQHWSWYQKYKKTGGKGMKLLEDDVEGGAGNGMEESVHGSDDWGLSGTVDLQFLKPLFNKTMPPIYRLLDLAFACSDGCCAPIDDEGHAWWG